MRALGFAVDWHRTARAASTAAALVRGRPGVRRVVGSTDGEAAAAVSGGDGTDIAAILEGQLLVAFEGRLDDFDDLRRLLAVDPDASPGQAIGAAYMRWGIWLGRQLRGDYAFVVWDARERQLVAARDPFGLRPLHYATFGGQIWIASDVNQFLEAGFPHREPDDQMVVEFLTREFRTLDRSFFREIARVPPGHLLIATESRTSTSDYREVPRDELRFSSRAECHEVLRARFLKSVERRLSRKKGSVVLLSGGVDSTTIACVADGLQKQRPGEFAPIVAASALHPGLPCDETPYIEAVARHIAFPVITWNGSTPDGSEFTAPLVVAPGARFVTSGGTNGQVAIAQYNNAEVLLDGTAGDQLGVPLGYEGDELSAADWRRLTPVVFGRELSAKTMLRWAAGVTVPIAIRRVLRRVRERLLPLPSKVPPSWLGSAVSFRACAMGASVSSHRFLSVAQRMRWETLVGPMLAAGIDLLQRHASHADLEVTLPFLDWDLVTFVLAVSPEHWPAPGWLARFHREALRRDLPPEVYYRRSKAEFTSAVANRIRCGLPIIRELCYGSRWESARFVAQTDARSLVENFASVSTPTFAGLYHLWAIASLEAWLRCVLDYPTSQSGGD